MSEVTTGSKPLVFKKRKSMRTKQVRFEPYETSDDEQQEQSITSVLGNENRIKRTNPSQLQSHTVKKSRKQYRPKVQSEWANEDIFKLIKAVEGRPSMWNKAMEEYKWPKVSAWQEVAKIIGKYFPDECKAKWNNLRVTFNINMGKYRQGSDERKKITWQFFTAMRFLEGADGRKSSQPTSIVNLESAITGPSSQLRIESSAVENRLPSTEKCSRKINNTKRPSAPLSLTPSLTTSNSNEFEEFVDQALNVMNNRPIKDEFSAFGEFIAAELRSIQGNRAAYVKRKLNRAFVDLMDEVALMDDVMVILPPSSEHDGEFKVDTALVPV